MTTEQKAGTGAAAGDPMSDVESCLGQAMVLIHRFLPRLDDPARGADVQAGFQQILDCIESARTAHGEFIQSRRPIVVSGQSRVEAEVVAVIAGAIAAILGQPYRLVAVQPLPQPAPHLNVWAVEGRTQIFQSHRIR